MIVLLDDATGMVGRTGDVVIEEKLAVLVDDKVADIVPALVAGVVVDVVGDVVEDVVADRTGPPISVVADWVTSAP